jgi:hypothetical protein
MKQEVNRRHAADKWALDDVVMTSEVGGGGFSNMVSLCARACARAGGFDRAWRTRRADLGNY